MGFEREGSWELKLIRGLWGILKKNRMTGGVIIQRKSNYKGLKLWPFGGRGGPNGGSEPKFVKWYEFRAQKRVSYQNLKVLRSKTKILKFWPFGGPGGPKGDPEPKFFKWYEIRAQKWVSYQNLKVLRSKTKILKFWPFGGPGGQTGAPNQNFSTGM